MSTRGRPRRVDVLRTSSGRISRSRESKLMGGDLVHTWWAVYFGRRGEKTKIGFSGSLANRADALRLEQQGAVRFSGLIYVPSSQAARKLEATLHKRFEAKRLHGEWFDLTWGDIATVLRECRAIGLGVKGYEPAPEETRVLSTLAYANRG